jgi:uncharacterized protein YifE (UPF0438 family)
MGETENGRDFSEEEQALLSKHLHFYRTLASGRRKPATAAQEHFVQVTLGHATAETPHEFAWIKYRRNCAERRELARAESTELKRDPELDGPTDGWFTREDWKKGRGRQRWQEMASANGRFCIVCYRLSGHRPVITFLPPFGKQCKCIEAGAARIENSAINATSTEPTNNFFIFNFLLAFVGGFCFFDSATYFRLRSRTIDERDC